MSTVHSEAPERRTIKSFVSDISSASLLTLVISPRVVISLLTDNSSTKASSSSTKAIGETSMISCLRTTRPLLASISSSEINPLEKLINPAASSASVLLNARSSISLIILFEENVFLSDGRVLSYTPII